MDIYEFDDALHNDFEVFCGVDEAGRGPLAGDVYASAVILPKDFRIDGINDSKKLSEKKRELLFDIIINNALSYKIATASVAEIDEINILNATMLAMKRAIEGLEIKPDIAIIDGNKTPQGLIIPAQFVIKGDATSQSIAAASILAKVARDRYMKEKATQYPNYLFEKHKGYGTKIHYEKIAEFGIIDGFHRRSFLKKVLNDKS